MKKVVSKISLKELKKMAQKGFGNLVKAVVDVKKQIMVVDGELHADEEEFLLKSGSKQENLWGINLYPAEKNKEKRVEFDSIINIKPYQNNLTRGVDNPKIRKKILKIVTKLLKE